MSSSVFQDSLSACLHIQVSLSLHASASMTSEELTLDVYKMKLYFRWVFDNLPILHLLWCCGKRYAIHEKITYGS